MGLTSEENRELTRLISKIEWPLDSHVFQAIANKVVTVPIELGVFNEKDEVLMFYREDEEYQGNHMPGTVLRDTDSVEEALQRLLKSEVVSGAGTETGNISTPQNLGWVEIPKGNGLGQNPTRHEISLLYFCRLTGFYQGKGQFYRVENLPENTLPHHRILIEKIRERMNVKK